MPPTSDSGEDSDGADSASACAALSLRLCAALFIVVGFLFTGAGAAQEETDCSRADTIAHFWGGVRQLGSIWACLDLAACAFCLSCGWLAPHVRTAREGVRAAIGRYMS